MQLTKFLFFIVCISFVLAIFCSVENPDIYYYMGSIRLLLDGKVPFVDFHIGYTPLSFYMAYLPASFFGTGNTAALAIETFMNFLNAGLVYYLLRKNVQNKVLCFFFTAFYLSSVFFLDGMCYMLEPYVTFWGLLSLIALYKNKLWTIFVAGICSFMSFWSKQYGLGYVILGIFYLLLYHRISWQSLFGRMFVFLVGLFGAAFCMIELLLMQGVSLASMFMFSGDTYEKLGLIGMLEGYGFLIIAVPFFPVMVYLIVKNFKSFCEDNFMVVCLCGVFGFMLTTYVRSYVHYIQLPLPFVMLLGAMLLDKYCIGKNDERLMKWFKISAIVPLSIMFYFDYNFIFHNERIAVNETANEIASIIPKGTEKVYVSSKLLCIGNINRYGAPMLEKWGMSNGFMEEGEALREVIMDADSYVMDPAKLDYLRQNESDLLKHIEEGRIRTKIACRDKRFIAIVYSKKK